MEELLLRIDLFEDRLNLLYSHVVNNSNRKDELFSEFPFAVVRKNQLYRGLSLPAENIYSLVDSNEIFEGQYSFSRNLITALEFSEKDWIDEYKKIIINLRDTETLSIESAYIYLDGEFHDLIHEIEQNWAPLVELDLAEYLFAKFNDEFQASLDVIQEYTFDEQEYVLKSGKIKLELIRDTETQIQFNAIPA